jgi:radical SAM-linked protein
MLKLFQRACVRAGIKTAYSQGFNPRPKLSLPLPKSVGIETDDDLLCLRLETSASSFDGEQFKAKLSSQLPEGCELLTVSVVEAKTSFEAGAATYVLAMQQEYLDEKLKSKIKHLLASKNLDLKRRRDPKNSKFKNVNVRPFLKSIELDDRNIVVECKISPAGSIRPDEILELLELDVEKLAAPIRRTTVQWQLSS